MTSSSHLRYRSLPSSEAIQQVWSQLATQYFEGRLPPIAILWSTRLTASAGMFVSRVGPRSRMVPGEIRQGASRVIRLSAPLLGGQSMEEVVRTLAHEMIHQWQFDIRHVRPNHGTDFLAMMGRMNQDGLGVSLYHHLDEAVQAWNRYAWQCLQCGYTYQRQRRTIRPARHRCGQCGGRLKEAHPPEIPVSPPVNTYHRVDLEAAVVLKGQATAYNQLALPF